MNIIYAEHLLTYVLSEMNRIRHEYLYAKQ